jgi:hypothetical protein
MNPFSGWVLACGLVLSSPALWAALVDGSLPLDTALLRFAITLAIAWLGLTLLAALVGRVPEPDPEPESDVLTATPVDPVPTEPDTTTSASAEPPSVSG